MANWREIVGKLLGISAYQLPPPEAGPTLDDPKIKRARKNYGGQLQQLPQTRTRWYLRDLESAIHAADNGDLAPAAQLYRAFRRDGVLSGLLATRTGGLVRLPKRFRGQAEIKEALEKTEGLNTRSVFDDMFPSAELALLAADGIALGIGVAELVEVEGRDFPVMVRVDPEFLRYRWAENRWYYVSIVGLIPITPGDGKWIVHIPGGRMAPWQHGLWTALGEAWINKQHSKLHRGNYSGKLANPARAAYAPAGASEDQRRGFLSKIMAWGVNSTFELPPGWEVKLLESNGRGYECFREEIADCNQEIIVALAGQTVTTDGGTGFANADIHKSIRADLIKETADALAYTINTQGIPSWIASRWGLAKLEEGGAIVEWIVDPPKDVKNEADSLESFGTAVQSITVALQPYGRRADIGALCNKFGIPIAEDSDGDGNPDNAGVEEPEPESIDVDFDEAA